MNLVYPVNVKLSDLAILLKRKQYKIVLEVTSATATNYHQYFHFQMYHFRALAESGKFASASSHCKQMIAVMPSNDSLYLQFQAWDIFLDLFVTESNNFQEVFKQLGEHVCNADMALKALACYLQSRVISFAMAVGSWPQNAINYTITLMQEAADTYLKIENPVEYGSAMKAVALLYSSSFTPDIPKAIQCLNQLLLFSAHPDHLYVTATIELSLIILENQEALNTGSFVNPEETEERINELVRKFQLADYVFGEADVKFEWGALLLEYGYENGLQFLYRAIELYDHHGEFSNRQSAWKKIAGWHERRGEVYEADRAYQESAKVDTHIELEMTEAITGIMKIHYAFMSKPDQEAVRLGRFYLKKYKESRMVPQIRALLANALSQGDGNAEALLHFEAIVNYYQVSAPSSFLSEALFNYSNALFTSDPVAAKSTALKAVSIALELKDYLSSGKYFRELALHLSQQKKSAPHLAGDNEIEDTFQKALDSFAHVQTLKAQIEKFNSIQQLGNHYFNERQLDQALNCLNQAHQFYHANNLRINSAFVLSHIGLLKFEAARSNHHPAQLLDAAEYFAKSAKDFIQVNGLRFSWRSTLLEAQSITEYATFCATAELAELNFERAQTSFLSAANVVDYLKGLQQAILAKYDEQFADAAGFSGLPADFNKVYTGAFKAAFYGRKRADLAFEWVERNKSRRLQTELWRTSNLFAPKDMAYVPGFEELRKTLMACQLEFSAERIMFCEFFILDQTIILFLMRPEWNSPKHCTIAVQLEEIGRVVNALINDPMENGEMTNALPLIQPILDHSDHDDLLYIIPHGFLHQLPFHMIDIGQGEYLIQRNPVAYLPALSILYHLQNKSSTNDEQAVAKFSVFGNSREDLKFSEEEAIYVSTLLASDCYLRNKADKDTFIRNLTNSSVLHYAGHAEAAPAKGLDQRLLLAGEESISASELMLIRNDLELLVLSGCQTGITAIEASTDEIIGFPAAALTAGTSAVITTLWKVEDKSTRQFFKYFYESYRNRNLSKIRSLQYAMKAMIKNPDYFPFNWAPFMFTGR